MRRALIRFTYIQSGSVFERTMHKRGVASFARKPHALRPPRTIGACCVFSGTKKDYYQILGLPRSASKPELKKKYFELAKKFHPDVNKEKGAEQTFKEISEAYEVLSDDQKRQMYDNFGHAGVDPNAQAGGDPFGGFGGGFGGFHAQQGGVNINMEDLSEMFEAAFGGRMNTKRGRDVQIGIKLSFLEAVNGCNKDVDVSYVERSGPRDRGTQKQKAVNISIPAGVESGMQLRVQGKGTPGQSGHKSGDLLVEVDVEEDPYFRRDGSDLHVEIPVGFAQAILGCTVDVLTLSGMVELKIPAGTQPGTKMIMKGKGVKNVNSISKGNQYVHVKVELPKKINDKQRELLKEFEEEESKKEKETTKIGATIEKAWERLKKFMGTTGEDSAKTKSSK